MNTAFPYFVCQFALTRLGQSVCRMDGPCLVRQPKRQGVLVRHKQMTRSVRGFDTFERSIFDRVSHGRDRVEATWSGLLSFGITYQTMQQPVSLYALQNDPSSDGYAIASGHRVVADLAQSSVHFYRGEQEWGKLAGTMSVDKWTGDWLIRSLGRYFRIDYQLSTNKAQASLQRNGYLTVESVHAIGRAVIYERLLAGNFWDYVVSFRGEVGFGGSVGEAVAVVRTRLNARNSQEQATIRLAIGPGSRFSQEQLQDFCQTNQLAAGVAYTQQELRQAVLRQRKINCERFQDQLRYFNIRINCR